MENQRVRMTKRLLSDSLLYLMQTKPIDEISVSELCRQAQVNRTTFYKYYACPHDILKDIASTNRDIYVSLCKNETTAYGQLNIALKNVVNNLERARVLNAEMMKSLENGRENTSCEDIFYRILSADLPPEVRIYCRVMTSAAMATWLNDPHRMATEAFTRLLLDISHLCKRHAAGKASLLNQKPNFRVDS